MSPKKKEEIAPQATETLVSDEGVPYEYLDDIHIVNLADETTDKDNARRRELHVAGRPFSHTGELNGKWLYRFDK